MVHTYSAATLEDNLEEAIAAQPAISSQLSAITAESEAEAKPAPASAAAVEEALPSAATKAIEAAAHPENLAGQQSGAPGGRSIAAGVETGVPGGRSIAAGVEQSATASMPRLSTVEGQARTAKSALIFTLEQLHTRRKKTEEEFTAKQQEIERIDQQIKEKQENLRQIDEILAASALLAEQVAKIDPNLLGHGAQKRAAYAGDGRRPHALPDKDDPTILRVDEVRAFFRDHPQPPPGRKGWTAAMILGQMPAIKQAHGKIYLPSALNNMKKEGKIRLVERGLYRAL